MGSTQMSERQGLQPRQARFVEEYLVDLNETAAAIRAGYSPRSARVMGSRLLSQNKVQEAVEAKARAASSRLHVTREGCLQALVEAFELARAKQDCRAMVGAIGELNKMCGFHAPKRVEVEHVRR